MGMTRTIAVQRLQLIVHVRQTIQNLDRRGRDARGVGAPGRIVGHLVLQ